MRKTIAEVNDYCFVTEVTKRDGTVYYVLDFKGKKYSGKLATNIINEQINKRQIMLETRQMSKELVQGTHKNLSNLKRLLNQVKT